MEIINLRLATYTVYVIYSECHKVKYTGQTENLERRLHEHNNDLLGNFTKGKGPWKLVYSLEFKTRTEALKYEKMLKSGKGCAFLMQKFGI